MTTRANGRDGFRIERSENGGTYTEVKKVSNVARLFSDNPANIKFTDKPPSRTASTTFAYRIFAYVNAARMTNKLLTDYVNPSNVGSVTITPTSDTFSVSGTITNSGGSGISGVTMNFVKVSGSGPLPSSTQTDIGGNWGQTNFQSGTTYRVTPSKSGYTFSPSLRDFNGMNTGLNFVGTPPSSTPNPTVSYMGHFANTGWMKNWAQNGQTAGTPGGNQLEAIKITTTSYSITYRAHVANDGWKPWVSDGDVAGTTGQGKSLQAIEIKLKNAPSNLHIYYRVYAHGQGWQGWFSDGATAGTTGKGLAVEAIEIKIQN